MTVPDVLGRLVEQQGLAEGEAHELMGAIMDGDVTPSQLGALLAALRAKRETPDEITGFARAMRERCVAVPSRRRPLVDTCGTGGASAGSFNVSTAAAFVVAASGVAVAKHGNRAVSGTCGSADVLEALGVNLELSAEQVAQCIDNVGVGFIYAPRHHPAMRHAAQTRRDLGIRTVFNVLGPLTNPAGAARQVVGVFDPDLCPKVAEALGRLGAERAMVVHGMDGLDEISTFGATRISHYQHGRVSTETRIPAEFFVAPCTSLDVAGAETAEDNAGLLLAVLQGEQGARRNIVAVNAAAGLILGGMAEGWRDGVALAQRMIDSGRARAVLNNLVWFTQRCSSDERPL